MLYDQMSLTDENQGYDVAKGHGVWAQVNIFLHNSCVVQFESRVQVVDSEW